MIDPVNNRGYYEYSKIGMDVGKNLENGEKFDLNYHLKDGEDKKTDEDEGGVVVELSSKSQTSTSFQRGEVKKENTPQEEVPILPSAESVGNFVKDIVSKITNFFENFKKAISDFWNSDSKPIEGENTSEEIAVIDTDGQIVEQDVDDSEPVEAHGDRHTGEKTDEYSEVGATIKNDMVTGVSALSQPPLQDVDKIRDYLEQSAERHYVKNSDLLTYYDKTGRIVQLNGADRKRILKGDKDELSS